MSSQLALEAFGDAAWRLAVPSVVDPRALLDALRTVPSVVDVVVCERHAVVTFEPSAPPDPVCLHEAFAATAARSRRHGSAVHRVRVRYDGEDLGDLSRQLGLSPAEVVALHAGPEYVVAAIGFQPGFAYLRGLDARLVLPRRATPRLRVPALSVALGGPYTGVYPFSSPGGWHLLGTAVQFAPFDALRGSALALGDRVRFVPDPG